MTEALDAITNAGPLDDSEPQTSLDRGALQRRWVLEIERYERKAQKFGKQGKRIIERYTAEKKDENASTTTFNVLWSNIQTLKPALYSKDPTPEVERRFKDKDPVGRVASDVIERACVNMLATQRFGDAVRQAVLDRLLPGRGVMWIRYLPHFRKMAGQDPASEDSGAQPQTAGQQQGIQALRGSKADGAELTSDAPEDLEEVYDEEIKFDFVPWTDFGHQVCRTWEECDGVWRIAYLDRQEVKRRFGPEVAEKVPYDQKPDGLDKESDGSSGLDKAKIYEIWDRRTKRVIRLCKDVPDVLEVQDDPLGLEEFWPLPKPLQATTSSKSFIPTADYILWQDQAKELDRLSQRVAMLTRAVKVVGVYDSSVQALGQLLSGGSENQLVPVDAWAAFAEKGGIKGAVELLDVQQIAQILLHLYEARDKVKADIYEISGLSDLLRGASDPEETATAQEIKSNYASVRLKDMQREVQVFARDAIKIAAEVICGQFSLDTIKQLCGVQLLTMAEKSMAQQQLQAQQLYQQHAQALMQQHQQAAQAAQPPAQPGATGAPPQPQALHQPPFNPTAVLGPPPQPLPPTVMDLLKQPTWEEVEQLLRNRPARMFRIDIETDSTIAQDERAEQTQRLEFAKTMGALIQSAEPIVQSVPELAPAICETFMFVLRAFKVGRPTESAFQEAMDKLTARAAQPQPPAPDDKAAAAQASIQVETMKQQGENMRAQGMAQADIQKIQLQGQQQLQLAEAKAQAEAHTTEIRESHARALAMYQADLQHQRETQRQMQDHEFRMATLTQKGAQHEAEMDMRATEAAAAPTQGNA